MGTKKDLRDTMYTLGAFHIHKLRICYKKLQKSYSLHFYLLRSFDWS